MSFAFSNEEDDDFGALSNNSNLASIFHDPGAHHSNTKSLVYTAPKQPSNQKPSVTTTHQADVVAAAAVTCYKLMNEKYEALPGKIGLALLGENETKIYRMILYQNKQKSLATAKITSDFVIISQPDNFCTFYDDHRQNWAILFDSKEVAQKFLGEIDQMKKSMLAGQNKPSPKEVSLSSKDSTDGILSSFIDNGASNQENSNKTKLISRIAKLGQPILPLSGAIIADESDSELVSAVQSSPEPELQPERNKPKKATRPVPTSTKPIAHPPVDHNNSFNSMIIPSHQYSPMMTGQQAYPVQMQFLPPAFAGNASNNIHHFDTLMSENRIHSSEVRMHLCRLTDKIDLLLQKTTVSESHTKDRNISAGEMHFDALASDLQKLQDQSNEHSSKLDLILNRMSTTNSKTEIHDNPTEESLTSRKELDGFIQQLKQENERLVLQMEEISDRKKESETCVRRLQEENARLKDDVVRASQKVADVSLTELKEENTRLATLLDASLKKEKDCASQQHEAQEKLEYYEAKCAETECHILQIRSLTEGKDRQLSELQEQVRDLERKSSHAKSFVETLQLKLKEAEVQKKLQDFEKDSVEGQVKTIMNKVYKEIMKQFRPDESYAFSSIKSTVSAVIRDVTLAVLNEEPIIKTDPVLQITIARVDPKVEGKEEVTVKATEAATVTQEDDESRQEDGNHTSVLEVAKTIPESESKERSISFLETLHSSLAAASLQNEQAWKPDPPPPPLFDDFDNEDDWLA